MRETNSTNRRQAGNLLLAAILLTASPVAGEPTAYEEPPTLSADVVLPAELREGPHHQVAEQVANDGYLNTYTIGSSFGTFTARGDDLLRVRIEEAAALAALSEVTKTEAFASAVGEAARRPVETAKNVVTQPIETLKGVPSGVGRLFKRTSRQVKKAVKQADEYIDEQQAEKETESEAGEATQGGSAAEVGEGEGTFDKTQEVATDVTKSYLGVGRQMREWAQKLGVDPYTTNEVLRKELDRVASAASVGSFGMRLVTPSLGFVDYLGEVNDLVWTMNATDLEVLNAKRLRQIGLEQPEIEALFENPAFSPTRLTGLVLALHDLASVWGRDALVRLAAAATSEEEAFFFQRSAEMLRIYHREVTPVKEIVAGPVWGGGVTAGGFAMMLAIDYLAWTESASAAFTAAAERYRAVGERRELWLAGRASPRARRELEALGWTVEEGARQRWLERADGSGAPSPGAK